MDRLFSTNIEDTEVYNTTVMETENVRDNPPEANLNKTANKAVKTEKL